MNHNIQTLKSVNFNLIRKIVKVDKNSFLTTLSEDCSNNESFSNSFKNDCFKSLERNTTELKNNNIKLNEVILLNGYTGFVADLYSSILLNEFRMYSFNKAHDFLTFFQKYSLVEDSYKIYYYATYFVQNTKGDKVGIIKTIFEIDKKSIFVTTNDNEILNLKSKHSVSKHISEFVNSKKTYEREPQFEIKMNISVETECDKDSSNSRLLISLYRDYCTFMESIFYTHVNVFNFCESKHIEFKVTKPISNIFYVPSFGLYNKDNKITKQSFTDMVRDLMKNVRESRLTPTIISNTQSVPNVNDALLLLALSNQKNTKRKRSDYDSDNEDNSTIEENNEDSSPNKK